MGGRYDLTDSEWSVNVRLAPQQRTSNHAIRKSRHYTSAFTSGADMLVVKLKRQELARNGHSIRNQ